MKKYLFSILAFTLCISVNIKAAEVKLFDSIVALVDDDVVLNSELERKIKGFKDRLKEKGANLPDEKTFKKQVLERLIIDSIQYQLAERSGVRVSDPELNATVANIAKNAHKTLDELKKAVEAEGDNYTLFREDLRKEIMISRVRQAQVSRKIYISEQEVDSMVQLMNDQSNNNIQYHIGHIMIAIPESSTPQEIKDARAKAQKVLKLLRSGEDFSKVAIANSDSQDALQGGDFGWRSLTQLPSLFTGPVSNMKVGDVTDPLRSASGLHILKLLEQKGGEKQTLVNQVKAQHILIKTSKITSEAQAQQLLMKLYKQIQDGADFGELAKKYSEDLGSGSRGGLLDWADPQIYAPKFRETLAQLKVNEVSQPFRSQFGWHIAKLLGRRVADETQKEKFNKARRLLFERKFDEAVNSWLREIRAEAYVKILHEEDFK